MEIEQYTEALLHGRKVDARQAKSALTKTLDKSFGIRWKIF